MAEPDFKKMMQCNLVIRLDEHGAHVIKNRYGNVVASAAIAALAINKPKEVRFLYFKEILDG